MAPKRARQASTSSTRNSPSEEQSSAGVGGEKFSSPEPAQEYNRLMSKAVTKERGLLPTRDDGNLVQMITDRGWETFCEIPETVSLAIVREFYANARAERNGYSFVRGFTVDYTPAAIARVLNLPRKPRGATDWSEKTKVDVDLEYIMGVLCVSGTSWKYMQGTQDPLTFPASALNRYAKAWTLFMCANISPSSHTHEVTVERAIILWGILHGDYIDLGALLNKSILKFLSGRTTGAIPHASLVTRFCAAVGVHWGVDEQLQLPSAPLDHSAIRRLENWEGGYAERSGLGSLHHKCSYVTMY